MRSAMLCVAGAILAMAAAPALAQTSSLGNKLAEQMCRSPANAPFALTDAEAQEFATTSFTGMHALYGNSLVFFDRLTDVTGSCFERTQDRFGNPVCRDAAVQRDRLVLTRQNWIQQAQCPSQQ